MAKRVQRYETDDIVVTFDPNRCIHAGRCVQGLPDVFDTSRRRWVAPEEAPADTVAEVIRRCPSGALAYERRDGGPAEEPDRPTSIRPARKGPLHLRGELMLADAEGNVTNIGPRASLCRCGASGNKPFCDLTHRSIGFEG